MKACNIQEVWSENCIMEIVGSSVLNSTRDQIRIFQPLVLEV